MASFGNSSTVSLSKGINTLIGLNNAGKSVLIKALPILHDNLDTGLLSIRVGQSSGNITLCLKEITMDDAFVIVAYSLLQSVMTSLSQMCASVIKIQESNSSSDNTDLRLSQS